MTEAQPEGRNNVSLSYDELPDVLDARALKNFLGISQAGTYNLMHRQDFPTMHIGNRLMVTKKHLLAWMLRHTNQCDLGLGSTVTDR